jgi:hypothetical protein
MGRQWRWRTETQNQFIRKTQYSYTWAYEVDFLKPHFTLLWALQNLWQLNFVNSLQSDIKWFKVGNSIFTKYLGSIIKVNASSWRCILSKFRSTQHTIDVNITFSWSWSHSVQFPHQTHVCQIYFSHF